MDRIPMDKDDLDIPWLKIIGEGFVVGFKWVAISLLCELPILIGMVFDLVSVKDGIRLAIAIPLMAVGMGVLFSLLGIIYMSYFRYGWARFLVLMVMVLFFGSQIMLLVLMPYVGIYGFIFQPMKSLLGQLVGISFYAVFMYWWTKLQYMIFIKENVIGKVLGWMIRTANATEHHHQKLREMLAKEGGPMQ